MPFFVPQQGYMPMQGPSMGMPVMQPSLPQGQVMGAPQPFYGLPSAPPPPQAAPRPQLTQNVVPAAPGPQLAQSSVPTPTRSVRGVAAEEREPRPIAVAVRIPSPEQLGIAAAPPLPGASGLDWGSIRKQLHDLGAVSFRVDPLPDGGTRFVCQLATAEFGQTQSIEAEAGTEAEAVRQALAKAELWKRRN